MEFVSHDLPERDTRPIPPKRNVEEDESCLLEAQTVDNGDNDCKETPSTDTDPGVDEDEDALNQIPKCASCGAAIQSQVTPITCEKCLSTRYCSNYCRQMDWEVGGHRDACSKLQETSDKSSDDKREESSSRHRQARRIPPPRTYSSESKEERFNYYRRKKKRSESFSSDDSVSIASVDTQGLRGLLSKRFGRHGRKKGPEKQYTNDDDLSLGQYMSTVSGRPRSKSFDLDEYAAEVLAKDGGHVQFSAEHGVFLSNVRMASVRGPTLASLGATSLSNIFRKKRYIDPALEIDANGEVLYGVDLDDGLDSEIPQLYMEPSLTKRLYVRIRRHCLYVYVCGFLALLVMAIVLPIGLRGNGSEDSSGESTSSQNSLTANKHTPGTASAANHAPSPTAVAPSTAHHAKPSGAPVANQTPTSIRDEFYQALKSVSFDGNTAINQKGTAQNEAFEWLIQSTDAPAMSPERRIQRYALATFFYSTGGDSWTNKTGWLDENVHECEWFSTDPPENICDSEGNYKVLALDSNDVGDVIPLEIGLLTGLGKLSLQGGPTRKLGGILPSSIGKLALLRQMDVKGNAIRGAIPSEIGSLRYMRFLSLTANFLSGTIPTNIGGLMQMTSFRADSNLLAGTLPTEFGLLLNLAQLFLGKNKLTGAIPVALTGLEGLKILGLENNKFTSMPLEMSLLQNLQHLSVANNPLVGTLMTEIGKLANLRTLNLHATGMTGRIPTTLGNLKALEQIDLSYNNFSGGIPTELGMLRNLADIALNANHLTGGVPDQLSLLGNLQVLLVQENNLTGGVTENTCSNLSTHQNLAFYADCGGDVPEFQCICCTHCCVDGQRCDFVP